MVTLSHGVNMASASHAVGPALTELEHDLIGRKIKSSVPALLTQP
jgi:hypothetical protein